jgi:hypothetical protein
VNSDILVNIYFIDALYSIYKMAFYDLNMNSKRITDCQDPSGVQDVATKNYVDTRALLSGATGATTTAGLVVGSGGAYAGSAPTVTVTTGTSVIISISANINDSTNTATTGYYSFDVSGASTISASDANSISAGLASISGEAGSFSRTFRLTGLTAGSNIFTAKYKAVGGTSVTFSNRDIVVFPL